MPGRYFRLTDDLHVPGRWHLRTPLDMKGQELNPWQFTKAHPVRVDGRPRIPLRVLGQPLDFTLGGLDIPVVHSKAAALLLELAPQDIQLIPVEVEGQTDSFSVLVATRLVQCIDDGASEEVRYWKPEDGRPEKVGQYRVVAGMRIDAAKVGDAQVFRTWGWTVALIVSERIKLALEHAGVTGLRFQEV